MEKLDFQRLAEFALSKWFWGTGGNIEHCVRAMIDEKFPYKYIIYAFDVSKNDYYYYLNLEIQKLLSSRIDCDIIKRLGISEEDLQIALKTNKKDEKGDME